MMRQKAKKTLAPEKQEALRLLWGILCGISLGLFLIRLMWHSPFCRGALIGGYAIAMFIVNRRALAKAEERKRAKKP